MNVSRELNKNIKKCCIRNGVDSDVINECQIRWYALLWDSLLQMKRKAHLNWFQSFDLHQFGDIYAHNNSLS